MEAETASVGLGKVGIHVLYMQLTQHLYSCWIEMVLHSIVVGTLHGTRFLPHSSTARLKSSLVAIPHWPL